MKVLMILILTGLGTLAYALSPQVAAPQKQEVVYHNANVHIGNGEVLKNATIAFDDGKIVRVGYYKIAWQETDIDLKGKHVYPGFILPVTALGLSEIGAVKATRDIKEIGELNASVRSIIAYNTDSEIPPTFKFNGILLAQPTPQGGLVSGLSSVVQLDAWNWEDAAIIIDDALHVNWPSAIKPKFDFATFTVSMQKNKNYDDELVKIKSLFSNAKSIVNDLSHTKNLNLLAVTPTFTGDRKVYIHTNSPKAIIESINFFKKQGVENLVLVAGQEVEPVIGFIKQSGVPVIVHSTHALPKRKDSSVDNGYTTAMKLDKAGVLVALAYTDSVMKARNLAFTAGTLVSYGMNKEQALQLITNNAAKILGIDKNYGTLEVGKSATLIITDGDALDMRGNKIEQAYIDGRKLNLTGRQQRLNQRYLDKYSGK